MDSLPLILIPCIVLTLFVVFYLVRSKKKKNTNEIYNIEPIIISNSKLQEVFNEINITRTYNNVPTLLSDKRTFNHAKKRAKDVYYYYLDEGIISHEGVGEEFSELMFFGADDVSECIGMGYRNPRAFVEALKDSEKHREAILSDKFDWCGIGLYIDKLSNTYFWSILLAGDDYLN